MLQDIRHICERAVSAANATTTTHTSPTAPHPVPPLESYDTNATTDSLVLLQQAYTQQQQIKVQESLMETQWQEVDEYEYEYDSVKEAIDGYDEEEEEEEAEEADSRRGHVELMKREEEEEEEEAEEGNMTLRIPPTPPHPSIHTSADTTLTSGGRTGRDRRRRKSR